LGDHRFCEAILFAFRSLKLLFIITEPVIVLAKREDLGFEKNAEKGEEQ
jgi:hypothetical protein